MDAGLDLKAEIRKFVMENAQSKGITEVPDDMSLTDGGIIDSLGIFRLVSFLEEAVGVHIGDDEIIVDNFQTIEAIERFVNAKLADKGEATTAR
jgi:acyl carrier protein